jgi:outer membrane protein OmpA-like peptidoglycan-associated protein
MKAASTQGLILCIGLALAAGCASPGKRTAIGAGTGAAGGAIIGGVAGGTKGAVIGAGVGAVAGGAVGNYLDKQAQELAEVAETKRTAEGILVNLKNDLLFETDSAVLKPAAVDRVVQLGEILAKYPEDRIRIGGHTDDTGPNGYNEELSRRRADAVKDVLKSRGVRDNQMLVMGYGETKPLASNKTSKGRSVNRRVELYIDVPQGSQAS